MFRIFLALLLIIGFISCQKETSIDNPDDLVDPIPGDCKLVKMVQGLDDLTDTVFLVETDSKNRVAKIIDSEFNFSHVATYDAIDRLVNVKTQDYIDSDLDFRYDANGRVVSVSYASPVRGYTYVFEYSTGKNPVRARYNWTYSGLPTFAGTEHYQFDTGGNLIIIDDTSDQGQVRRTEYMYNLETNPIPRSLLQFEFGSSMTFFNERAMYFSKNMITEWKTFYLGKTQEIAQVRYELNDKEQISVLEQEWIDPDGLEPSTLLTMRFFYECK